MRWRWKTQRCTKWEFSAIWKTQSRVPCLPLPCTRSAPSPSYAVPHHPYCCLPPQHLPWLGRLLPYSLDPLAAGKSTAQELHTARLPDLYLLLPAPISPEILLAWSIFDFFSITRLHVYFIKKKTLQASHVRIFKLSCVNFEEGPGFQVQCPFLFIIIQRNIQCIQTTPYFKYVLLRKDVILQLVWNMDTLWAIPILKC
jgi:hypothetical protein